MKYNELSELGKKKAREWVGEGFSDVFSEHIKDDMKYLLDEKGLPSEDIRFSLSYSQGDGVSFFGDLDLEELTEKAKLPILTMVAFTDSFKELEVSFKLSTCGPSNFYCHSNTMYVEANYDHIHDATDEQEALIETVRAALEVYAKEVADELEKSGYSTVEYQNGEEYLKELIESNNYDFCECGSHLKGAAA